MTETTRTKKGVQSWYELPFYERLVRDAKKNKRAIHAHQEFIITEYLDKLAGVGTAGQQ